MDCKKRPKFKPPSKGGSYKPPKATQPNPLSAPRSVIGHVVGQSQGPLPERFSNSQTHNSHRLPSTSQTPLGNSQTPLRNSQTPLGTSLTPLGTSQTPLGTSQTSLGNSQTSLGNSQTSLDNSQTSLGNSQTSLGNSQISIGNSPTPQSLADADTTQPPPDDNQPETFESQHGIGQAQSTETESRDRNGRFKPKPNKQPQPRSEAQKKADKIASNIAKWKAAAVKSMEKIQQASPEASQCYTMQSNKFRGSKDALVFRTNGAKIPAPVIVTDMESTLGEDTSQLEPYAGVPAAEVLVTSSSSRIRLSELRCFICHEQLGADHSKRVVCCKRDCYRSPLHLACSNFDFPASFIPKVRCYYMCPEHRGREQESESDEEEDSPAQDMVAPPSSVRGSGLRVRKRNDNILKPVKLSTQMMEVFGSTVRYQEPNEVRRMLASYKKHLEVVNKQLVPDKPLSILLGNGEHFKSGELFKMLKRVKHIQSS